MPARVVRIGTEALRAASETILGGGVVAIPTDTVYGLACDPKSEAAVRALFEVKRRDSKPIPLLCSSLGRAREVVRLEGYALALARLHWPGGLTLVAPLARQLPSLLSQGTGCLGVRVPAHDFCLSLAEACGGYITGTSANISGEPSCRTAEAVLASVGESVEVVVDGGRLDGRESTVVKIVGESVEVLRRGAVRIEPGVEELSP